MEYESATAYVITVLWWVCLRNFWVFFILSWQQDNVPSFETFNTQSCTGTDCESAACRRDSPTWSVSVSPISSRPWGRRWRASVWRSTPCHVTAWRRCRRRGGASWRRTTSKVTTGLVSPLSGVLRWDSWVLSQCQEGWSQDILLLPYTGLGLFQALKVQSNLSKHGAGRCMLS